MLFNSSQGIGDFSLNVLVQHLWVEALNLISSLIKQFGLFSPGVTQGLAVLNVLVFFGIWLLLWLPIAIPLAILLRWRPPNPPTTQQKIPLVLSLYALVPLILWAVAQIDQQPFTSYGLTWEVSCLISILVGLAIGVAGIGLLVGLEYLLGWVDWRSRPWTEVATVVLPTLLLALLVSVVEELVFRGFLVNQLRQDYPLWLTAIGSSLIFSLLHLVWDGREALPQLPGLCLMGLVLVLARWIDVGSLGLAIGLHAGWILGVASLDSTQLIHYRDRAPIWITGIDNKPLAGAMGLLLLLLTASVLLPLSSRG